MGYAWFWEKCSIFSEDEIFAQTPSILSNEVTNYIHASELVKIAIFKQPAFRTDAGFTATMLRMMKPEYCPASDYIMVPGRKSAAMLGTSASAPGSAHPVGTKGTSGSSSSSSSGSGSSSSGGPKIAPDMGLASLSPSPSPFPFPSPS